MNKKTNTVFFILAATAFNILITVVSFFVFLVIYSKFLSPNIPESMAPWIIPILFIVSITVSFFVYRLVIKTIIKKVDMEKYFSPVFTPRRS